MKKTNTSTALVHRPQQGALKVPAKTESACKLFVLDTNVLMHDPSCLFRFAEHDVYIPMVTLEELDEHKRGQTEVARNARAVSRSLDTLMNRFEGDIREGIPLSEESGGATGRLFLQVAGMKIKSLPSFTTKKADNEIIAVVASLRTEGEKRNAILVSKDINMRIKARALSIPAEDYRNDQVLDDKDVMHSGMRELPPDFWETHSDMEVRKHDGFTQYRIRGSFASSLLPNEFVCGIRPDGSPFYGWVRERGDRYAILSTFEMYMNRKKSVWSITARNPQQGFGLSLLMNPDIDFVSLLGVAGTGKTLLALAAGLHQTITVNRFTEIIMTRAPVPVAGEIGYLPGTEEEKMHPWMGALEDNLEVLQGNSAEKGNWEKSPTIDLMRSRVKLKNLGFMRGRTFINKFVIIDEAQNLTPKQMKTITTRAGPGTKIVCLGNIAQIDTPYLTEGSSGLTYAVERFKGWKHAGHITLVRGERSRLADFANDVM